MKVFEALCLKLHWRLYLLVCYNITIDCVLHNPHYTLCVGRKFMSLGYKNPQKKHEFLKPPSRGSGDTKLQDHACLTLPFLQFCFPGVCSRSQQTADMQPIALIALATQTIVADPHHTQFNRREGRFACFANFFDNYSYRQCAN